MNNNTFTVKELRKALKWMDTHKCTVPKTKRLITLFWASNGIGQEVKAVCKCGKDKDVTDISCW
jgi:hypothetical protein